ncbi:hypothetical protein BSI_06020 [Bacillus inaquosorum KCTC 13429]|uniref:Uncharacterized protein n=1 Tax=Bacillus inaquosorum KCTC 13429 TaxID=1236548 RepID=A0A9W5PEY9_9BACI|nr:hypothetical protein BSI_06020 [Bacillus inaquosorum KCTC 13429]
MSFASFLKCVEHKKALPLCKEELERSNLRLICKNAMF